MRLTFLGESTYEPVLGKVARDTAIDFSILTGRIDYIRQTPYGQLVVAFTQGDIPAALTQLTKQGLTVEVLRA